MNDRIKELARQAGVYFGEAHVDYFGDEYPSYISTREMDVEKFTELLIKECHETIKKDMELAQIQLLPLDFGMYANGRLRRIIKEHFGVE
jgi:hypothetical protein